MVAPHVAPDRQILKSYPPELPKSPPPTEFSDDLFPTEFVDDVAKQEAPMPSAKNIADMSPDEALRHVIAKARAADEAMAKTKPQQLGERGAVALGKQPISPQPSPHVFRDPQMEKTFQLGREAMDTPSFLDRVYEGLEDMAHGWTRTFKHLPNTPKFSRANEYLSQLKNAPRYGAERAIRVMRGIVDDLTPDEFDLFERLIIMQDANFDALAKKTLPDGWTPRGVANELQHLTQKSLQTPKVQQAIDLRFRMINQLREELTDAGILNIDPANVNPHYFPHIVRDYAEEAIKQAESGAGLSIKKQTPWYAKSRKGTGCSRIHSADWPSRRMPATHMVSSRLAVNTGAAFTSTKTSALSAIGPRPYVPRQPSSRRLPNHQCADRLREPLPGCLMRNASMSDRTHKRTLLLGSSTTALGKSE